MRPLWLALIIVAVDQTTKAVVQQKMHLGESIALLGDWLKFTYTQNSGMAFGIELGSPLVVTVLAIVATVLILFYFRVISADHKGYRMSLALILGGAAGNIIDRIFFAKLYGYGTILQGKVIDFIHVDLWTGYIPDALPFIGGSYFSLFPIWNVADMSIVVGVVLVVMFQHAAQKRERLEAEAASGGVVSDEAPASQVEILPADF